MYKTNKTRRKFFAKNKNFESIIGEALPLLVAIGIFILLYSL